MAQPTSLPYGILSPTISSSFDWIIFFVALIIVFGLSIFCYQNWNKKLYRRPLTPFKANILEELNNILKQNTENCLSQSQCYQVWKLIRLLTLEYLGHTVLNLNANAFIDKCAQQVKEPYSDELFTVLQELSEAIYDAGISIDKGKLKRTLMQWIHDESALVGY